jgi:hypothetical protein
LEVTSKGGALSEARNSTFDNVVIIKSHKRERDRGNDRLPNGSEHLLVEDTRIADHEFS